MTVVVGLVPGPEGEAAVAAGSTEAGRRGARLVLVNVNRADRLVDRSILPEERIAEVEEELRAGGVDVEVVRPLGAGSIADALVRVADDLDAALIVIGIRRRSPVGKLLLGSNASEVLLSASCPVLAVKAEPTT